MRINYRCLLNHNHYLDAISAAGCDKQNKASHLQEARRIKALLDILQEEEQIKTYSIKDKLISLSAYLRDIADGSGMDSHQMKAHARHGLRFAGEIIKDLGEEKNDSNPR